MIRNFVKFINDSQFLYVVPLVLNITRCYKIE